MPERIISADQSIIVAADIKGKQFPDLVNQTGDVDGISAYKLGFTVGYSRLSLPAAVDYIKEHTDKLVIFDHQKAATDIDRTGEDYASTMEDAGVDAAILFPFTGPVVEERWVRELQERGIGVIVGAEMTHKGMTAEEGGYLQADAFKRMFEQAVELGVTDFVVPGNKPEKVKGYREYFDAALGVGEFALYAPGFIDQGGNIAETGAVAGPRFHAIVGSGIIKAENPREAALNIARGI